MSRCGRTLLSESNREIRVVTRVASSYDVGLRFSIPDATVAFVSDHFGSRWHEGSSALTDTASVRLGRRQSSHDPLVCCKQNRLRCVCDPVIPQCSQTAMMRPRCVRSAYCLTLAWRALSRSHGGVCRRSPRWTCPPSGRMSVSTDAVRGVCCSARARADSTHMRSRVLDIAGCRSSHIRCVRGVVSRD